MRALPVLLAGLCATLPGFAQDEPENLSDAIAAGEVRLADIHGTGYSTGRALEGLLLNDSGRSRVFSVMLDEPLFLENQGAGSNMLVTKIYHKERPAYYTEGDERVIWVPDGTTKLAVSFGAYSLDFDRHGPTEDEGLEIADMPRGLESLARELGRIERAAKTLNADYVGKGLQVAVWFALGVSLEDIARSFEYDPDHLDIAKALLERLPLE